MAIENMTKDFQSMKVIINDNVENLQMAIKQSKGLHDAITKLKADNEDVKKIKSDLEALKKEIDSHIEALSAKIKRLFDKYEQLLKSGA